MAEPTIQDLDRRLATLEGWKEAQEKVFLGFKEDLQDIKGRITTLDERLTGRITTLDERLTGQITILDERLTGQITILDERLTGQITAVDQRLAGQNAALAQKVDLQFRWLVGIQLTMLVAIIGALVGVLLAG